METRAVCALSPEKVVLGTVTVPDPGPNDVMVHTVYSMISTGTERWVITGQFHAPGEKPGGYPLVPGYQKVGTVAAVGSAVQGLVPGQWVFATNSRISSGATSTWGGHIEHSLWDEHEIIPLPEGLDPMKAVGLVLTQVGYNGGSRPPVHDGTRALVVGDGLVGHWVAQMLRWRGARVIIAGRRPERLALARRYSANVVVNVRETPLERVAAEHAPAGFDIVADTVGTAASVREVIHYIRHNGHLILNGYYREGEHLLSIQALHSREITVHTPAGWTRERLLATLELVAHGMLCVRELVTHVIPAEDAARAYDLVLRKPEPFLGICLKWRNAVR